MRVQSTAAMASPRQLICQWNPGLVAAALAVSLLGAFTSTQLMCQARASRTLSGVMIWTVLGSLIFGFCATWCLHFIGMLSCEFDLPIGLNAPLTILSAVLAVVFTFGALSTELIRKRYRRTCRKNPNVRRHRVGFIEERHPGSHTELRPSSEPLLRSSREPLESQPQNSVVRPLINMFPENATADQTNTGTSSSDTLLPDVGAADTAFSRTNHGEGATADDDEHTYDYNDVESVRSHSTTESQPRRSFNDLSSDVIAPALSRLTTNRVYERSRAPGRNVLVFAAVAIYEGLTLVNAIKGFVWSIALTSMHFVGTSALQIPNGFIALNLGRVMLCATISWSVCCVGVILMAEMVVSIPQQLLFSAVAATGVAAVHFSGMYATSFWSREEPSSERGYPIALPIAIASIAIVTCMAASGLLAHSATVARDKLAEIVYTRKRLWAAIAQKENAEAAAAARSEFIASASHEIRTPLHQLQGYSDLLSNTELTEEGRHLLLSIQHATKSLSMITSNVLDWSRLEKGEAICRPVPVDIRLACEAIINLLPNRDDESDTDLINVVTPEVPLSVSIDEVFLQRILMNLLSNAFKFTLSGYVVLLVEFKESAIHATVKDTGVGVPDSFLPQLFEPFKQVQARGAERGTGLGLSITKQLLQRMQGDIAVESKYQHKNDVGAANSGTTFTITIPVTAFENLPGNSVLDFVKQLRIVIMHDAKRRDLEGITDAWRKFGAEVIHTNDISDIPNDPDTIIWADLHYLNKHPTTSLKIRSSQQQLFLVPYDNKNLLDQIFGSLPPINIVPIRKPLIWHRMLQTITEARQSQQKPRSNESIMPKPKTDALKDLTKEDKPQANTRKKTVLLVEDNKINQKLGVKMLTMLHYDVLIAEDGQEAIEIVKECPLTIDAILMDQSMPRKDGITSTREIRALEAAGLLGAKRQTIIAVTAAAGPEAQAQFLAAGTDIYLSKPLSLVKLEQTLSYCFNGG